MGQKTIDNLKRLNDMPMEFNRKDVADHGSKREFYPNEERIIFHIISQER